MYFNYTSIIFVKDIYTETLASMGVSIKLTENQGYQRRKNRESTYPAFSHASSCWSLPASAYGEE